MAQRRAGSSVLDALGDRAALERAQTGMNPLTVCLRRGSGLLSDPQFVAV